MTPLNPILRSGIKAVGFIGSGVIVARDFASPEPLYLLRPARNHVTGRGWISGTGAQPAMIRACARASVLSVTAGNRRRNSTAAENSPPCSKAARIAAAWLSVTVNMRRAWASVAQRASKESIRISGVAGTDGGIGGNLRG
jgi:hypothetical protein